MYSANEDKIANDYFNTLNGTISFIILGIYFSIIESNNYQIYAIISSIVIFLYVFFYFPEYTKIAKKYNNRYSGIWKILSLLRISIFVFCYSLLVMAAFEYRPFTIKFWFKNKFFTSYFKDFDRLSRLYSSQWINEEIDWLS